MTSTSSTARRSGRRAPARRQDVRARPHHPSRTSGTAASPWCWSTSTCRRSSPGSTCARCEQMSGALDFGEVFFTDAGCRATSVLGEVGGGWDVAMLLLSFERGASAMGQYTSFRRELDDIVDVAHRHDREGRPHAAEDPVLRQRSRSPSSSSRHCGCTRCTCSPRWSGARSWAAVVGDEAAVERDAPGHGRAGIDVYGLAGSSARPRGRPRAGGAPAGVPVVAVGDHLGRLLAGAAHHRRRAVLGLPRPPSSAGG